MQQSIFIPSGVIIFIVDTIQCDTNKTKELNIAENNGYSRQQIIRPDN
jgi:hypothetical protein